MRWYKVGKRRKKRKLKKWVKKTLIVIPIITILLVITISIKNMKPTFASSKTTSKIEKEMKTTKKIIIKKNCLKKN